MDEIHQDLNPAASAVPQVDKLDIFIWETLGTLFFAYGIFTSAGNTNQNQYFQALSQAMIMGTIIWIALPFTGSHYNPSISLNMYLRKKIDLTSFFIYIGSQFFGLILACALFNLMNSTPSIVEPNISTDGWDQFRQLIGEILGTLILNHLINIQTTPISKLTSDNGHIGLMFTLFFFISRQYPLVSGSCLNPAIGLIPSLYNAIFYGQTISKTIYIYIVGPFIGGALGFVSFEYLYLPFLRIKKEQ